MKYIVEIIIDLDDEYTKEEIYNMVEENMLGHIDCAPFSVSIGKIDNIIEEIKTFTILCSNCNNDFKPDIENVCFAYADGYEDVLWIKCPYCKYVQELDKE